MKRIPRGRYFAQCCEEPFRIFFPLGLLVGLMGVSLWPLYFSGIHEAYPGIMHARLMVEGFLGAFMFGFLGTAGPRLTSTPPFSRRELTCLLSLFLLVVGLQIAECVALGDGAFLLLLIAFARFMVPRFVRSEELPPPGFVLVGFGFVAAIAGTILLLIGATGSPICWALGSVFLNQLFVLLPVLGIGSFLLPRFLNVTTGGRGRPASWRRQAAYAAMTGIVITASFVAEVLEVSSRGMSLTRFAVTISFIASQIPLHRGSIGRSTLPQCLRLAIVLLLAGMLSQAIWPGQRLASLHVVFIGGFSLITFTVATRVVLGHGGLSHLFGGALLPVLGMALLLVGAMALRFIGDFEPAARPAMLTYAGLIWMAGAVLWASFILPKTLLVDAEEMAAEACDDRDPEACELEL
jgi:uncharacterized protein involved in response to NO